MIQPLGMKKKALILSSHCLSKFQLYSNSCCKPVWERSGVKSIYINKGVLQSLDILFEVKFFYVAKHIIFMQWVNTGNSTLAVCHHLPLLGADPGGGLGS